MCEPVSQIQSASHINGKVIVRERSGSVVECLTRDPGAAGWSLTGVPALWSLSKIHLSLLIVLVQPRKTSPCITERLLMGRKKSNKQKVMGEL